MSSYVISDIHGDYDAFIEMLKLIEFSDTDTLYINGDVIDRGKNGIKILQYILKKENIHMILGNHEYMCMQYFTIPNDTDTVRRWNRNGNFTTLKELDNLSDCEKNEIIKYISQLPSMLKVNVNGKIFIIVHGFLADETYDRVWNRPKYDEDVCLNSNEILIVGHTPVCEYVCPGTDEEKYVYSHILTEHNEHFKILHARGFIDIDCCLAYGMSASRLACLKLDDGEEFYVKGSMK